MCASGVERTVCEAGSGIEGAEGEEIWVCGYYDVVGGVEGYVLFVSNVACDGVDFDAGVEFLDLRGGCFCALYFVSTGNVDRPESD